MDGYSGPGPPDMAGEDDEELLMCGVPDDLGDLMLEMREGGAWAESLAMDCDAPPATHHAQARAAGLASPPPRPAGLVQASPADPLATLLTMSQQHHAQQAADAAAGAALQPTVRALLLHPPSAQAGDGRGALGPHMVPVAMQPASGQGGQAALAQAPPASWPAPAFYSQTSPLGGFYGSARQQAPPSFLAFQTPAGSCGSMAPLPGRQALPGLHEQQGGAQGVDTAALLARFAAQQQQQEQQGGTSGSGSGSGEASDGTTLRLRRSIDSINGSASLPLPAGGRPYLSGHGLAPPPQHMCSAAVLAAFDMAATAYDAAACTGGTGGTTCFTAEHGVPSDSSDCEDGPLERQHSQMQVVPDANPFAAASLQTFCADFSSPGAQTARVARHASLERFRQKKARRGFGNKKIRYQARKDNADKRPRVKGRFVKAGEAATMLATESAPSMELSAAVADI